MLRLKELKNMVEVADVKKRVPKPKALRTSNIPIVVKEVIGADSDITVYANGYVLYREENRTTVFPLHQCKSYEYETSCGENEKLGAGFFENENWYMRLIMEGTDLLFRSQEKIQINHGICSYSGVSEEWEELKDPKESILDEVLRKEVVEELLNSLNEKQRKAVMLYYFEELNQKDISKIMGISQQSVAGLIKRALTIMKKNSEN